MAGEDLREIIIRPWDPAQDRVEEITTLLHAAYAEWKEAGQRFTATWQDNEITLDRLETAAEAWVARESWVWDNSIYNSEFTDLTIRLPKSRLVATIALYAHDPNHDVPYYRGPGLFYFGQFGVHPDLKGTGLGKRLLQTATDYALAHGGTELACDTSENAQKLIDLYTRWGFSEVDRFRWHSTNYESLVLSRPLK